MLVLDALRCPCRNKQSLHYAGPASLRCATGDCTRIFPIVDGVPVLINDETSVFRVSDFLEHANTTVKIHETPLRRAGKKLLRFIPRLGTNWKANENLQKLRRLLPPRPTVLVIGAGTGDPAVARTLPASEIERVDMDVYFAPEIGLIADAHDLPFPDEHFDAVISQSVLEHVADPYRSVAEIYRVLEHGGARLCGDAVYAAGAPGRIRFHAVYSERTPAFIPPV